MHKKDVQPLDDQDFSASCLEEAEREYKTLRTRGWTPQECQIIALLKIGRMVDYLSTHAGCNYPS
jgi:hypothetical protein